MNKKITTFDLETTGLDTQEDRIVQIAIIESDSDLNVLNTYNTYVNPQNRKMSEDAKEITGITDEMLKDKKTFKEIWKDIEHYFDSEHDILTFNGNSFDSSILFSECRRIGVRISFLNKKMYDSYILEKILNSCSLSSTYERYIGKTMEEDGLDKHNALSDVKATIEIYKLQLDLLKKSDEEKNNLYEEKTKFLAIGNKINSKGGEVVFGIGKYKNKSIQEVIKEDSQYIKWVFENWGVKNGDADLISTLKNEIVTFKNNNNEKI